MQQAMREEFEAWFVRNYALKINGGHYGFSLDRYESPPHQYIYDTPFHDWRVWQASRAALRVEDEIDRLKAEIDQCASALPGTYYMDPPDGGNVSIPEQIRRMAKDAARYRWLRERDLETISRGGVFAGMTPENIVLNLEDLDAEIDAAIEGAKQ
ncbi:hypothetical protein [Pseudomonas aeruginosa]|uniref:hypothetical protein n=1 Tax=Pseudomonas aeruginosa TaxID=287 RepID=UPI0003B9F96C|nr:hypothetical protein [Pseudomonas aeruginosa]ERW65351.1 hypothetical protein Q026_03427 [Pseudomonas aeruginosa BWHPSA013]HCF0216097.1 hypothetical protein [Pseudomonas aeruginosa]HCF4466103.1 hypothetical protein [Pseudomonas aeruginosa]